MNDKKDYNQDLEIEEEGVTKVGTNPKKRLVITIGAIIAVICVLYFFFWSGDSSNKKELTSGRKDLNKIAEQLDQATRPSPQQEIIERPVKLPELPKLTTPSLTLAPPPQPTKDLLQQLEKEAKKPISTPNKPDIALPAQLPNSPSGMVSRDRWSNQMVAIGGGAGGQLPGDSFAIPVNLTASAAQKVEAKLVGDLKFMIIQGKMIDAVLETPINTDVEGPVRGMVTRDVFSEAGRNILIPKGSRIIGEFEYAPVNMSQARVKINWKRIILPRGVDINVESPATDEIGYAGVEGKLNNKLFNTLTTTMLVNLINGAQVWAINQLPQRDIVETITGGGNVLTTNVGAQATSQAVKDLSTNLQDIIKKYKDENPTVSITQGTEFKIFVARDLVFPKKSVKAAYYEDNAYNY